MIKVTDLKKLRNNTYLVTVSEHSNEKQIVLTEDIMIQHNLLSPKEIDEYEYSRIMRKNEESLLYQKAIHFIDYQMRSISEVKKHLRKTVQDEQLINKMIKRLKETNYLDDNRYVTEFVTQKMDYDLVGPVFIKEKLIKKGIHYDLIDAHLIKYKKELQFDKVQTIINNECKYPIKKPFKKAYLSLKQKLVNKGFTLDVIESALISNNELIKDACLEDELLEKELIQLRKQYDFDNYQDKDKVIKKLIQKGYDYQLIMKQF